MQAAFLSAFSHVGYDYFTEDSSSLSDVYCASKQIRTRSTTGRLNFLAEIEQYIPLGIAAEGDGEIEIADGITVEHVARKEFATFRRFLGLDDGRFIQSFSTVTGGAASDGGRSGSLYWFSSNGRYILKSSSQSDFDKLVDMMPRYLAHFLEAEQAGRPCFLLRFFGAYRFRAGSETLGLICMNDVWDGQKPIRIYDIKGTTHHRFVDEEDDAGVVLKDLNLQSYIILDCLKGAEVWEAFRHDSDFLEQENSIDYSLLLGIDDTNLIEPPKLNWITAREIEKLPCYSGVEVPHVAQEEDARALPVLCGRANAEDEEEVEEEQLEAERRRVRMGIIDFLGQWNTRKKAERWYKNLTGACCMEHSSEPPDYYRERWVSFLEDKIFVEEEPSRRAP